MSLPRVPKELWISRFAAKLLLDQPAVPPDIATELALAIYHSMYVLRPEEAVVTLLAIHADQNKWAAGYAQQLALKLRGLSNKPKSGS